MRGSRRVALLIAAASALAASAAAAQARQVTIQVQAAGDRSILGHSVIAIPALDFERFTGPSGSLVVAAPSGALAVSVKRLGFVPKDTLLEVGDAPTQRFVVALDRLSVRLGEVRVDAWPPCLEPGIPHEIRQREAWAVVGQLRQNAERFDLLVKTYPFIYTAERTFSWRAGDGPEITQLVDTILLPGDPAWRYRPGTLVRAQGRGLIFSSRSYTMVLPTLRDFASRAFLDNHCFHLAGVEEKAGQRLLRMDIVAAERLKDPDVNVAVWLDTTEFRIRFATLELTKYPAQLKDLARTRSEITYLELLPFVPVMYVTTGENLEKGAAATARRLLERQQVLDVRYLGAHPDSSRPDAATTRPPR